MNGDTRNAKSSNYTANYNRNGNQNSNVRQYHGSQKSNEMATSNGHSQGHANAMDERLENHQSPVKIPQQQQQPQSAPVIAYKPKHLQLEDSVTFNQSLQLMGNGHGAKHTRRQDFPQVRPSSSFFSSKLRIVLSLTLH